MQTTGPLGQCVTLLLILAVCTSTVAAAGIPPATADDSPSRSTGTTTASAAQEWTEYRSVVIFRNDDPKPKWDLGTLKAVNQIFIEEQVPVTHGVIPADAGGVSHQKNGQFCQYLRQVESSNPALIEYAQHGYSHEAITDFQGGSSEFAKLSRTQQRKRVTTGKEYFEECVGEKPTVFVPPYNTYDETTVDVLDEQGYQVVSGGPIVSDYYGNSGAFTQGGLEHIMQSQGMIEQWSPEVKIYDTPALKRMFDKRYEDGELYVQMMHYPHFDTQAERSRLRALIEHMKGKDVRFMTLGEFATATANGNLEQTADGWRVRESSDGGDDGDDTPAPPENPPQFDVEQAVHTTADLNVRDTPDGDRVGTAETGTDATIVDGPVSEAGFVWYRLEYESGLTGWSVQQYLAAGHTEDPNQAPTPVIGVPPTIERGESVTFDGSLSTDDGQITSYTWYVGDTPIGSGETIERSFASTGQRSITLRVTDDDGATASTTETFLVKEPGGDGGNGRFNIGDKVTTVTQTELRLTPNPEGAELLTLIPGREATITKGPINTEGVVWYEIELQSGVSGYVRASTLQQR